MQVEEKFGDSPKANMGGEDQSKSKKKLFDFKSLVCSTEEIEAGNSLQANRRFSPVRARLSSTDRFAESYSPSTRLDAISSPMTPIRASDIELISRTKLGRERIDQLDKLFQNLIVKQHNGSSSPAAAAVDLPEPNVSAIKSPRKIRKRLKNAFQSHKPEEFGLVEDLVYQVRTGFLNEAELLRYLSHRFSVQPEQLVTIDYQSCQVQFSPQVQKVSLVKLGEPDPESPEVHDTVFEKHEPAPAIAVNPPEPDPKLLSKKRRKKKKRRRMKRLTPQAKEELYEWREDLDPTKPLITCDPPKLDTATLPLPPSISSSNLKSMQSSQTNNTSVQSTTEEAISNASQVVQHTHQPENSSPAGNNSNSVKNGKQYARQENAEPAAQFASPPSPPRPVSLEVPRSPVRARTYSAGSPRLPSPRNSFSSRGRRVSGADDPFQGLSQLRAEYNKSENQLGKNEIESEQTNRNTGPMNDVETESWRLVLLQLGSRATYQDIQSCGLPFTQPIDKVLRSGFPLEKPSPQTRNTILFDAIEAGCPVLVERLLSAGSKLHQQSRHGLPDTALHVAVSRCQLECAKLVLKCDRSQLEVRDRSGQLPIHVALGLLKEEDSYCVQMKILQVLLEFGANVSSTDAFLRNCLHYACERGFLEPLDLLLKQEVRTSTAINAQDFAGCTPLHIASLRGNIQCVTLLLENGANAKARNLQGQRPLDLAVTSGHHTCATALFRPTESS